MFVLQLNERLNVGIMKFAVTETIYNFLKEYAGHKAEFQQHDYMEYLELKSLWLKHKSKCLDEIPSFQSLIKSSNIKWRDLYPPQKQKTPEEMKRYQARLQELEYKVLTKNMEKQDNTIFQV